MFARLRDGLLTNIIVRSILHRYVTSHEEESVMTETAGLALQLDWPPALIEEFEQNRKNGRVGQMLVSETEKVRVWHLTLAPNERIGFHCHVLNYFWTALTGGKARSHYSDGRTVEVSYKAGDTKHMTYGTGERMEHDLENIGKTPLQFVTVEFKDSPNAPLPL
jgi:mannose-6-phosphate isomerase-like protein (cupin superfamily)